MTDTQQALLQKAKTGDINARNELIASSRPFVMKVSARFCGRRLDWENDEELSVALIAFNEAIDTYDPLQGAAFSSYAYLVITRRLTDFLRQQSKQRTVSAEDSFLDKQLYSVSQGSGSRDMESIFWREEIEAYNTALAACGITFQDLVSGTPKHLRVRRQLAQLAAEIASDQALTDYIHRNHKLPVKEICRQMKVRRKFIETWRRYLLAMVIAATGSEFTMISEYICSLFQEGREKS